jgi:hypothetical protein
MTEKGFDIGWWWERFSSAEFLNAGEDRFAIEADLVAEIVLHRGNVGAGDGTDLADASALEAVASKNGTGGREEAITRRAFRIGVLKHSFINGRLNHSSDLGDRQTLVL